MARPSLSTSDFKRVGYAALFAFVGAFASLSSGVGGFHNFGEAKAAVLALLPAAIAAALSAAKNAVTAEGSALK